MQLKKSLGQHFLIDRQWIDRIMEVLMQDKQARILEVGPGGGALTQQLLELKEVTFKAVEVDDEKVDFLKKKFSSLADNLIHTSFLDMAAPFDQPFTLIGNFPYNISTEILFKVLEWKDLVPTVIGMFQKEVAQRVAAVPGSKMYGVTSALIQPYYEIEYLFDVPPDAFLPPPKVVSGVIRMKRKTSGLQLRSERDYRNLVKTAFNQRRKKLRNAVRGLFAPEVLQDPIFDQRAEQLSIQEFAQLTYRMI